MKTLKKSETGIWAFVILSLFFVFSIGFLVYEARGVLTQVTLHTEHEAADASLSKDPLSPPLQQKINRFLALAFLMVLGLSIVVLVVLLKPFSGASGRFGDEEDEADLLIDWEEDDPLDIDIEDIEDGEDEQEVIHGSGETEDPDKQALEHSYSRIMETLQKVNELEKKHSIELAEANAKLEKEVTVREHAEKEIRRLSRKLIDGTEEAQKNLAQDLHDEFGQTLAALHMGLESLDNGIPEEMTRQKKHIRELIPVVEQLGEKIRSISSNLRPDLLDDLGLIPTLDWYIKEFQEKRAEPVIDFQSVGFKKRLSPEIELVLYRIFQESINNIVKHSEARNTYVMLTYNYPKVILMVKDDGKGFEPGGRFSGIGLIGMRERAESMNGNLEIRSEFGKGTSIRAELPVQ